MMQAGAVYENQYFLGTSIARPLIAKRMIEIARRKRPTPSPTAPPARATTRCRFELTAAALAPELRVIAPWRDASFRAQFPGRAEMIEYCEDKGIPVRPRPRSRIRWTATSCTFPSRRHFGRPVAGRLRAGTQGDVQIERLARGRAGQAEYVTLDFEKGDCVAVNGKKLTPLGVMRTLNKLGGKHGVGRVDLVENRFVGMKSRGVYETPGGAILHFAHRQMETLTMDREVMHLRDSLDSEVRRVGLLRLLVFARAPRLAGAGRPRARKTSPARCG
jgi:argininosuccinate synthase